MRKSNLLILLAALALLAIPVPAIHAADQVVLRTQQDKDNYRTGVEFVRMLKKKGGAINLDIVIKGMQDELTGENLLPAEGDNGGQAVEVPDGTAEDASALAAACPSGTSDSGAAAKQTAGNGGPVAGASLAQRSGPAAAETGSAPNGSAAAAQRDAVVAELAAQGEQEGRIAPDGTVLSSRNQALMRVRELKASMNKIR